MSFHASGDATQRTGGEGRPAEPRPGADAPTGGGPPAGSGMPAGADTAAEPAPGTQPARAGQIPHTRTALAYNALIAGAIVLILLLVFILENTKSVNIAYFGVSFHMPLGVALLLAAIGGALLMGIVGTARIVQLRRRLRRQR